jgi:HEAT repeat protein
MRALRVLLVFLPVAVAGACLADQAPGKAAVLAKLRSPVAAERIAGLKAAAVIFYDDYCDALLELLKDEDRAVRRQTILCWTDLASSSRPYVPVEEMQDKDGEWPSIIQSEKVMAPLLLAFSSLEATDPSLLDEIGRAYASWMFPARDLVGSNSFRCGNGYTESLEYKAGLALRRVFTRSPDLATRLIADPDPSLVLSAGGCMPAEVLRGHLPRLRTLFKTGSKLQKAVAASLISNAMGEDPTPELYSLFEESDEDLLEFAETVCRADDHTIVNGLLDRSGKLGPHYLQWLARLATNADGADEELKKLTRSLLTHPEGRVRRQILMSSTIEPTVEQEPLIRSFLSDPFGQVRGAALLALAQLKVKDLPALTARMLADEDKSARSSAIRCASDVKDDPRIAGLVVRAVELGVYDYSPAFSALEGPTNAAIRERCMRSALPDVRSLGAWCTEGDLRHLGSLLALVDDSDDRVAKAAIRSLERCGTAKMVPRLMKRLATARTDLEDAIISCLGEIGDASTVAVLEGLEGSTNRPWIRRRAELAVGNIKERLARH